MEQAVTCGRRAEERHTEPLTEHFAARVDVFDAREDPEHQLMIFERRAVAGERDLIVRTAVDVVEDHAVCTPPGGFAQIRDVQTVPHRLRLPLTC